MDENVGELLRRWRKEKGLKQAYVAKQMHVNRSTICNYENDKRHLTCDFLIGICQVLEIPPTEFFAGPQANRSETRYVVQSMLDILDDDQLHVLMGYIDRLLDGDRSRAGLEEKKAEYG